VTLTRRSLIAAGAGAAGALVLPRLRGLGTAQERGFREPPVLTSTDGVLEATLRVALSDVPVAEPAGPRRVRTRAYNGTVPGPTLRVRAGDRLRLLLVNDLPRERPFCRGAWAAAGGPHGFDATNLHTHGLHVSPASLYGAGGRRAGAAPVLASDDASLVIGPGGRQRYCLWLPAFHAPGTFWYHPHKHGSVALQVAGGLVGALIVEEEPGHEIAPAARDVVWIIHEVAGQHAEALYTHDPPLPRFYVNGTSQPTLRLRPGEVQRWRFVNATGTPAGYGEIKLVDGAGHAHPLHLVAVDGITFYGKAPQAKLAWIVPPGGRADFLVQLNRPGRYRVVKDIVRAAPATFRQDLASVEVAGAEAAASLPARLPAERPGYLEPIREAVERPAKVRFRIRVRPAGEHRPCGLHGNGFEINEKTYRPDLVDHAVSLNAAEQWELTNTSSMTHPFHIHVNPFQVVDGPDHLIEPDAPDTPDNWIWRDTAGIPPGTEARPGRLRIRTRFLTYHGQYVLHCHFLDHEDLGMMQNVLVRGAGVPPCTPAEGSG
jgi:FtsP/CotA-like multicopper oxidase with cupredoxin domain